MAREPSRCLLEAFKGGLHKLYKGELEAVKALLAAGADPNATMSSGETPLHIAVRLHIGELGQQLAAALLCAPGLDLDARDIVGSTPLHAALQHDNYGVAAALRAAGAELCFDPTTGWSRLHQAAALGESDTIRRLLAQGEELGAPVAGRLPLLL
jgi:ankyrin repeat protein